MTRLNTNSRLNYDPGHLETPIEGIGGMYRFWKSIDSKDRDKLVELFEFGHQNPGEGAPDTSRMDWQSLAEQQKDAYENGYDGPVELMNKGWDYAIDDALNHKPESATDRLVHKQASHGAEATDEAPTDSKSDDKPGESESDDKPSDDYDWDKHLAGIKALSEMDDESRRAHARAANWRVGNDERWRHPQPVDENGKRLQWPTAPFDDDDLNAERLAGIEDAAYQGERSGHRRSL